MKRITGSLVVCVGAGVFTAGALFYHPTDNEVAQAPAQPRAGAVAPQATGSTLEITGFEFGSVSAKPSAVVAVVNRDAAAHTVTADNGAFNTKANRGSPASFRAPAAAGTYSFFCAIHPEMNGTLVVR
jgi:plastocyanin